MGRKSLDLGHLYIVFLVKHLIIWIDIWKYILTYGNHQRRAKIKPTTNNFFKMEIPIIRIYQDNIEKQAELTNY
jgi:hypothetical protein